MQVVGDYGMRKKLVILGLTLLVLSGFSLILRVLGSRGLVAGLYNHLHNSVPGSEPQIPIIMVLLRVGLLILSSMGIMMGIIITVIGAVSPPLKKTARVERTYVGF